MKLRYDHEDDVMMIWFSQAKVDHAEQNGDLIVHFSTNRKPVLLEILNASHFLKKASSSLPKQIRTQIALMS